MPEQSFVHPYKNRRYHLAALKSVIFSHLLSSSQNQNKQTSNLKKSQKNGRNLKIEDDRFLGVHQRYRYFSSFVHEPETCLPKTYEPVCQGYTIKVCIPLYRIKSETGFPKRKHLLRLRTLHVTTIRFSQLLSSRNRSKTETIIKLN